MNGRTGAQQREAEQGHPSGGENTRGQAFFQSESSS